MRMSVKPDLFVVFVSQRRIEGLQRSGLVCLLWFGVSQVIKLGAGDRKKTVGSLA